MDFWQTTALAILQGITEFLPISSSAHLILLPWLMGWEDQGLGFDLAVHLGTLTAVVVYFRRELIAMSHDWFQSVARREPIGESRLAWAVILGTIPVGIAGLLFQDAVATILRAPMVIAVTTVAYGLLLWWADARWRGERDEHSLTWRDVLIVGCAQALALVPGTSRSGITMTAALMCGLSREGAARFSFLLAIPVTALAGGLIIVELILRPQPVDWSMLWLGALISAVTAFLCIHYFLRLLTRFGFTPYVVYRLLLGLLIVVVFI